MKAIDYFSIDHNSPTHTGAQDHTKYNLGFRILFFYNAHARLSQCKMTGSGAAEFATLVHHNHRGTIVGEESGGDYNGINAYDRTYLRLPNSKIGVLIAGYRSIMPWNEKQYFGRGVPVDYEVHSQIIDLLNEQDAELDFVYELIKKNK